MNRSLLILFLALSAASFVSGCRGEISEEPPVVPLRNMYHQARYDPHEESEFFEDGRTMRPQVEGTLSREMEVNETFTTGRTADNAQWILEVPSEIVDRNGGAEDFVARGQERYNIYCAPCHGVAGDSEGLVSDRAANLGFAALRPPSFHEDRIRSMPDGQLYATISNGIRNMPAYRHNIPQDDRWAIALYVRALQVSQASRTDAMNMPSAAEAEVQQ